MSRNGREIASIFVGLFTHPGDLAAGTPDGTQPGPAWITGTCVIVLGAAYTAVAVQIGSELDDWHFRRQQSERGFVTRKNLTYRKNIRKAAVATRASLRDVRPSRLDADE